MSEQEHEHTGTAPKKMGKLLPLIVIILIIGGGIFLMNKMGIKILDTGEEIEIVNNPKSKKTWKEFKAEKEKQRSQEDVYEQRAAEWLQQFINYERKDRNITPDESDFLKNMTDKIDREGKINDAKNYFQFMNSSFRFYKKLKDLSSSPSQHIPSKAKIPGNESEIQSVIKKMMDIDSKELNDFSKENPGTEEWLEYIDQN